MKKQTQAAHSNSTDKHISSMINKKTNKQPQFSIFELFIKLVKTHIDNPFQWKPSSDLQKMAKKFTAEYNRQHSGK